MVPLAGGAALGLREEKAETSRGIGAAAGKGAKIS